MEPALQQAQDAQKSQDAEKSAVWFFRSVFEGAQEYAREIGIWTLQDKASSRFMTCTDASTYAMARAAAGMDVYFGVGLLGDVEGTGRGAYHNVKGITAIWFDIDIAGITHAEQTRHGEKHLPKTEAAALEILRRAGLPPSIVIHSGGGIHAYWLLKEPWMFMTAKERDDCQAFVKRWGRTICSVGRSMGYDLDNLSDLPRVLRVPGTSNNKTGKPIPVVVRSPAVGAPRSMIPDYAPDDFEIYFAADEFQPDEAGKLPVITVDSLVLDPKAEVYDEKLEALKTNNDNFRNSWEMKRTDMRDRSASGYEMSLLSIAASVGWTDQELANLSIHWRRAKNQTPEKCFRRGYLQKLIAKAKTPMERQRAMDKLEEDDLPGVEDKPLLDPDKRAERIYYLNKVLGLKVSRLLQEGEQAKDSLYTLILEDGRRVCIGGAAQITSLTKFREAVFSVTALWPSITPKEWPLIVKKLGSLRELQDNTESDDVELILEYLKQYLRTRSDVVDSEDWMQNFQDGSPFMHGGRLHIHLPSFLRYVNRTLSDPMLKNQLWIMLRAAGFVNVKLTAKVCGKPYGRSLWRMDKAQFDVRSLFVPESPQEKEPSDEQLVGA